MGADANGAAGLPTVTFPLASVGAMALTVYTGSVVAAVPVSTDAGSNRAWLVHVVTTILLATTWRLLIGKGPLERVVSWSSAKAAPLPAARRRAPEPQRPS